MKKFLYMALALSLGGAVLSGILLIQHYYPETNMGILSCGNGLENPCMVVSQSGYSTVLGIPLAAFGLLFYLFIIFALLIADYAGGWYNRVTAAILLPLTAASVAADIALVAILIIIGEICTLCIYTYLVNILLFLTVIVWYKKIPAEEKTGLIATYKEILTPEENNADRKAAISSFTLFAFLLAFAVFSTNHILQVKTPEKKVTRQQINSFLTNFYKAPREDISLPSSKLILGNPEAELEIIAFTDFLCSACYSFYKTEKYLLSKFRGKIKIIYYNYPLDSRCNEDVARSLYENSCIASRAAVAAAELDIFPEYIVRHFAHYKSIKKSYSSDWAMRVLQETVDNKGISDIDQDSFQKRMNSMVTTSIISEHVNSAIDNGINATPTLFINGRKLVGVPPREMFSALIERELKKKK